ncbi:MAG: phosphatase PAP2 family protein [Actinomycetes bacterium]
MNYSLFRDINNLSGNPTVDTVMKAAASYLIFGVFAVLAVLCLLRLWRREWRPVIATGAALVLTFVLALVGGALYAEKRPFVTHHVHQLVAHTADQSFPSDHATAAFGIALAVWVFLSWRWGAVLFAAALLIGFARVYDGIHYPLDIAGGLVAAAVATAIVAVVVACLDASRGRARRARRDDVRRRAMLRR